MVSRRMYASSVRMRLVLKLMSRLRPSADHPEVKACKVDVDAEPALASRFGVMSIPTLIYFEDGKQIGKAVGVQMKEQIAAALGV